MPLELLMVTALPAIGFLILGALLYRWGRKHDPMRPSHLDHLSPRFGRYRDEDDD
jgi:hypothetical protein